ncbi:porphobilinogen synthase [Succinimonas sp.]|uniref:porphobilinogen synthase n=1 Tax=Succinimonas sp. TaxID=1936151 RepID=UPI00386E8B50
MRLRLRRLRTSETVRDLVRENEVRLADLIYPVFAAEGSGIRNPVASMPGIYQFSVDMLMPEIDRAVALGIRAFLLFGIPLHKDETGSGAWAEDNVVAAAIRAVKRKYPEVVLIADICLCEYTSHGHCGLIHDGCIMNDETLPLLSRMAVTMAEAGADIVAPSDMMDGRIGYIRDDLDRRGFFGVSVMAYSAKFASAYYSPFRDAAHSAPSFGDRKSYQMDPANGREALRELAEDAAEGADYLMVKPALAYLDVLKEARQNFRLPLVTYNVSGEYAMVKAASAAGYIDEKRIVHENLLAMKRAGADLIISYHALDYAQWLSEGQRL